MPDAGTIGSMVAITMSMVAEAMLKGTVAEVVKDAYKAVKTRLLPSAEHDVRALEVAPNSVARQGVIAEIVDHLPDSELAELRRLVEQLADSLKAGIENGAVGLDIKYLEAANFVIDSLRVESGTGARIDTLKLSQDLRVGPIEVGGSTQKK
jgi:hypothetical protein